MYPRREMSGAACVSLMNNTDLPASISAKTKYQFLKRVTNEHNKYF